MYWVIAFCVIYKLCVKLTLMCGVSLELQVDLMNFCPKQSCFIAIFGRLIYNIFPHSECEGESIDFGIEKKIVNGITKVISTFSHWTLLLLFLGKEYINSQEDSWKFYSVYSLIVMIFIMTKWVIQLSVHGNGRNIWAFNLGLILMELFTEMNRLATQKSVGRIQYDMCMLITKQRKYEILLLSLLNE